MDPTWEKVLDEDILIPGIMFGGGVIIAVVAIIFCNVRAIVTARAREQTKRELAAYVAEGTLDPDKAVAMINAGESAAGDDEE